MKQTNLAQDMLQHSELFTTINRQKSTIVVLSIVLAGIILLFLSTVSWIAQPYSEFLSRLGTILVPAGAVSFISDYSLRQTFLKEMRSHLAEAVRDEFSLLSEMRESGIQRIHREFSVDQIVRGFSAAQNCILILTTWLPNVVSMENTFPDAIKRGCRIQILFLHSKSDFAMYRGKDLGYTEEESVGREIVATLAELSRFCNENDVFNNVEIRLYKDTTPTLVLFIYDDTFVFSPYFKRKMGLQSPQIEVKGTASLLGMMLKEHFDDIWKTATPYVDLSNH
jgi:Domain of unknown function (DUF5919)